MTHSRVYILGGNRKVSAENKNIKRNDLGEKELKAANKTNNTEGSVERYAGVRALIQYTV